MDVPMHLELLASDMQHSQQEIVNYYPYIDAHYYNLLGCSDPLLYIILNRLKSVVHHQTDSKIQEYLGIILHNRPQYINNKLHQLHGECIFKIYQNTTIEWTTIEIPTLFYLVEEHSEMIHKQDLEVMCRIILERLNFNAEQGLNCLLQCKELRLDLDLNAVIPYLSSFSVLVIDILQYAPIEVKRNSLNEMKTANLAFKDIIYGYRYFKDALNSSDIQTLYRFDIEFEDLEDFLSIVIFCTKFHLDPNFINVLIGKTVDILLEHEEDDPNSSGLLSETLLGVLINLSQILCHYHVYNWSAENEKFIWFHWAIMYALSNDMIFDYPPQPQAIHIISQVSNFESLFLASHIWNSYALTSNHPHELIELAVHYIDHYANEPQVMNGVLGVLSMTNLDTSFIVSKLYRSIKILSLKLSSENLVTVGCILGKWFTNNPRKLNTILNIDLPMLPLLDIIEGVLKVDNQQLNILILEFIAKEKFINDDPFIVLKCLELTSKIENDNSLLLVHHLLNTYSHIVYQVLRARENSLDHVDDGIDCMSLLLSNISRRDSLQKESVMDQLVRLLLVIDVSYILDLKLLQKLLLSINELLCFNVSFLFNRSLLQIILAFAKYSEIEEGLKYVYSHFMVHKQEESFVRELSNIILSEFIQNGKFIEIMPYVFTILDLETVQVDWRQEKELIICTNQVQIRSKLLYFRLKHRS
eukprot:NODE_8_length_66115_cov_0.981823.p5 type:complete len:699 gc:universal NODE_8_length_66115_cov_0.981823:34942-32846(-)